MNAMLNIQIRVNAAQATAQVNALRSAVGSMGATGAGTAAGGMTKLNSAFQMSNLEKFGKNLQWTGRQLEYNFTLPILLAGGAATKFALDNEAAFTQIQKAYGAFNDTAGDTKAELDALRTSFELLSNRFGVHQKDVLAIATDWAQAGAAGVALAKATRLTMETMVLAQEDASTATQQLLTIQGAYRLNTDQLRGALVSLNAIQVTTAIEFGGLVDAVSRAGGAAASAGIDINHLAAMAAALVPATGSAAAAGNALRTIISRLMSPTKQSAEEMALMGISVTDASWQAMNGVQRIEALSQAFEGLSDGQKNLVSSVIASRWQINRFDILMNDIADSTGVYNTALKNTADTQKSNALYAQQLSTVLSSTPQAFKILTTNIQNALAKAIMPLLPALVMLLSQVVKLTTWFGNLNPDLRQFIMTMLLLLAAIGPVTRYMGSFTLLFTTMGKAVGFVTGRLFGYTAAQEVANVATGQTSIQMVRQQGIITGLFSALKSIFMLPFRALSFMFETMWAGFNLGAQGALAAVDGPFLKLLSIPFAVIGGVMQGMWTYFLMGVDLAISGVTRFAVYLYSNFLPLIGQLGTWLATALPAAAQAAAQGMVVAFTWAGDMIVGAYSVITTTIAEFSAIFVAIVNQTESMTRAIWAMGAMAVRAIWVGMVTFATAVSDGITMAWIAASNFVAAAWTAAAAFIESAWATFALFMDALPTIILGIMTKAATLVAFVWENAAIWAQKAWSTFMLVLDFLPVLAASMWEGIVAIWEAGYAALEGLTAGFAAVMEGFSAALELILANPIVALVAVIVVALGALVYVFRDEIVGGIIDAFNKLPAGIKNILLNIINMIKTFALTVKDWLSHLNPFQRHSPSLVDNVTNGMATILDEYKTLLLIPGIIRKAVDAQKQFDEAVQAGTKSLQLEDFQQEKLAIIAVAPDAGGAIDNLIASIFEMEDALKAVNVELQAQQTLVDQMQGQIDRDMKPYNDAIYANEEAQKRLRLEILKMKTAGQSIDDIKNKMASLAGEIESLQGQKTELRLAGAGSDILKGYDDQITALQAQSQEYQQQGDQIQKLQDELSALQDQAEMINLEKDLTFDPQLKALDEQKDKLAQLKDAYDGINSAINAMTSSLNQMASAAKAAQADAGSLNEQQFNAASDANFADVTGDTIPGLGREGDLSDIQDFNAEMQKELDDALSNMGGFDMFAPIKDAWNAAWGWIKDNVGPVVGPVWDAVYNFFAGLDFSSIGDLFSSMFGGADASGPLVSTLNSISDALGTFWDLVKSVGGFLAAVFGPVFAWIGEQVVKAGNAIGPELAKWEPMFGKVIEAVSHIANIIEWAFKEIIAPSIKAALFVILAIWNAVWPLLQDVLEPIINAIIGVIKGALEIIRGVISFVLDLINGDWGNAWNDILTVVTGIWDAIYSVIALPIDLIMGIVHGLVDGIIGFFTFLWDTLVGHSIIPDMMNAIVWWFNFLLAPIKAVWNLLWSGISWVWDNVGVPIFSGIQWVISNVLIPAFNTGKDIAGAAFSALGSGLSWVWNNIISPVFEAIKTGIGAVGSAISWVVEYIIKPVWSTIGSVISAAFDVMGSIIEAGINFFIDAFNGLASAINAISDTIGLGFHIDYKNHVSFGGGGPSDAGQRGRAYAAGGVPVWDMGGPGGVTNIPTALVGEGSTTYPEYVIPTDPTHRARALALFASLGTKLLDAGDVIGGLLGPVGGSLFSGGADAVTGAADLARKFWDIIHSVVDGIGNVSVQIIRDVASTLKDKVVDWGVDKINSIPGVGLVTDVVGSIKDAGASGILGGALGSLFAAGGVIPSLGAGGIVPPRPGGTLIRVAEKGQSEAVVYPLGDSGQGGDTYNFYGNMEFPNITKSEDAGKFLKNLSNLVA